MGGLWYVSKNGNQEGPVEQDTLKAQLASGEVGLETLVWAPGRAEWTAARSVPELIPAPPPLPSTMAPPSLPRRATKRFEFEDGKAEPSPPPLPNRSAPPPLPAGRPVQAPTTTDAIASAPSAPSPTLVLAFLLGSMISLATMYALARAGAVRLTGLMALVATGLSVAGIVFSCIFIYRAWGLLPPSLRTTSPGMAVGLLFVPFFNLYWTFVAIRGLSVQTNTALTSRKAPPVPLHHALLTCITFAGSMLFMLVPVIGVFMMAASSLCFGLWVIAQARGSAALAGQSDPMPAGSTWTGGLIGASLALVLAGMAADMAPPPQPNSDVRQSTPPTGPAPFFRQSNTSPIQSNSPPLSAGPCLMCGGSGSKSSPCFTCDGSGKFRGSQCRSCQGKGFPRCGACNGTGKQRSP